MTSEDPSTAIVPHLYLDTNVIIDTLFDRPRGDDSIELVESIRNRGWRCSTSVFAVMELLKDRQEERFVDDRRRAGEQFRSIYRDISGRSMDKPVLDEIYGQVMRRLDIRYPFIDYPYLTDQGWEEAVRICGTTDIDAADAVHVVTAKEQGCDLFVTKDGPLTGRIRNQLRAYIEVSSPQNVDGAVRQMGFTTLR